MYIDCRRKSRAGYHTSVEGCKLPPWGSHLPNQTPPRSVLHTYGRRGKGCCASYPPSKEKRRLNPGFPVACMCLNRTSPCKVKPAPFPASPSGGTEPAAGSGGRAGGRCPPPGLPRGCWAGREAGPGRSGAGQPRRSAARKRSGGQGWAGVCAELPHPLLLPADLPMEAAGEPLFPREEVLSGGA